MPIMSYISFMKVIENFLLLSISNLRGVKACTTINRIQERFDIYIMAFTLVGSIETIRLSALQCNIKFSNYKLIFNTDHMSNEHYEEQNLGLK